MALELATAPTTEPVSLTELKDHLRVDITDDDALILAIGEAAREFVESHLRRALITQTWDLWLDKWPANGVFKIPLPPLQSVTHIKYYDEDDAEATFASSNYFVDTISKPGRVVLNADASLPTTTLRPVNAVNVRFVAGHGTASAVPSKFKSAIMLIAGSLYENREEIIAAPGVNIQRLPLGVQALLTPERVAKF